MLILDRKPGKGQLRVIARILRDIFLYKVVTVQTSNRWAPHGQSKDQKNYAFHCPKILQFLGKHMLEESSEESINKTLL